MKTRIVVVSLFLIAMMFMAAPAPVHAELPPLPQGQSGVAPGEWEVSTDSFSLVPQASLTIAAAPWLQLLTDGITLSAPATICHEFRGGQFGWKGEIRKLEGDKWVKLVTTVKWTPDTEGKLMACAYAPTAGTYALFGYFSEADAPAVVVAGCPYEDFGVEYIDRRNNGSELSSLIVLFSPALPEGTQVSFYVENDEGITIASGSATVQSDGLLYLAGTFSYTEADEYFDFFFTTLGSCTAWRRIGLQN